jgi:hypothetical protein
MVASIDITGFMYCHGLNRGLIQLEVFCVRLFSVNIDRKAAFVLKTNRNDGVFDGQFS